MSRVVYMSEERERQAFAERAAAKFSADAKLWTYTDADVEPDEWFAVRWGLHDRAVLVFKVGDVPPVVYADLVPRAGGEA